MCGLVGMISYNKGGFYAADRDAFQEMLIVNSLRGADSTGIFGGKFGGVPDYAKKVGNPFDLIQDTQVKPMWNKMLQKYNYIIGHGRSATRGKVIAQNAHPFQVNHITMVHNGTVMKSELVDTIKHEVDSNAICHALAENSAADVLPDINGAYALIWHDFKKQTLNVARNKERPLSIAFDRKEKVVYIASERAFLNLLALRRNIALSDAILVPEESIIVFDRISFDYDILETKKKAKIYSVPLHTPTNYPTITAPSAGRIIKAVSRTTGFSLEVDSEVDFTIDEVAEIKTRGGDKIFHVFGKLAGFPEAEVMYIWRKEEALIYEHLNWKAKIKNINYSTAKEQQHGISFTIYVADVAPAELITYDGLVMDELEFVSLTEKGCTRCGSPILIEDAAETLFLDDLCFCSDCSEEVFKNGYTLPTNVELALAQGAV